MPYRNMTTDLQRAALHALADLLSLDEEITYNEGQIETISELFASLTDEGVEVEDYRNSVEKVKKKEY